MATPNIVPRADSEGALGTASKYWGSAYIDAIYVGGGKVGRDADNNIDFVTDNQIAIKIGGSNEILIDTVQMFPATNDGMALGYPGNGWSDLYLASGAVINFDNGNATLTHSNDRLKINDNTELAFGDGQDLKIKHDTNNSRIENSTGNLTISNIADDSDIIFTCDDGSGGETVYFRLDGSVAKTEFAKHTSHKDGVKAYFGDGLDLELSHDGNNSWINNGTGNLTILNNTNDGDIIFKSDDGSGGTTEYFRVDGGNEDIDFSKSAHFLDNVNVKIGSASGGDLQLYHNGAHSLISNQTGNLLIRSETADGDISFLSDNGQSNGASTTYFYLDGSSATHDGSATTALYTNWPDKSRISLGTSHDIYMYHDGANTWFENQTGDLTFRNSADDKDIIFQSDDGSGGTTTYLHIDGNSVLSKFLKPVNFGVDGAGVDVKFFLNASGRYIMVDEDDNSLIFTDNANAKWGNGGDLQISHDGTDSRIDNMVGHLKIRNYADDSDIIFETDNGSGGTTAYLTLDGTNVRTKIHKSLNIEDNIQLQIGNSQDLKLYHNASHSYIEQAGTGNLYIQSLVDDGDIIFLASTGSATPAAYLTLDGGLGFTTVQKAMRFNDGVGVQFGTGSDFSISHNGTDSNIANFTGNLNITANSGDMNITNTVHGGDIYLKAENPSGTLHTYLQVDGGSEIIQVHKDIYALDNIKLRAGNDGDLQIYHNGSHSYIDHAGTGAFYIRTKNNSSIYLQDTNGQAMAQFTDGGGSHLYCANNLKFSTSSAGVDVTGDVSITSTAASAVGGGFDGAETVAIQIGEVNQEIITTIQIDLGTGGATDIVSSGTAGDVIGENDTAAAFITKYDSTKSGVLYKAELICLETPAGGDTDINLVLNATSLAEDAAGEAEGHVIVDGGAQTIGMRTESTASVVTAAAGAHNDYIYLTHGGTTAGTYSAGKFLIRLYGAKATL